MKNRILSALKHEFAERLFLDIVAVLATAGLATIVEVWKVLIH